MVDKTRALQPLPSRDKHLELIECPDCDGTGGEWISHSDQDREVWERCLTCSGETVVLAVDNESLLYQWIVSRRPLIIRDGERVGVRLTPCHPYESNGYGFVIEVCWPKGASHAATS